MQVVPAGQDVYGGQRELKLVYAVAAVYCCR
jgi:hypothetical protein